MPELFDLFAANELNHFMLAIAEVMRKAAMRLDIINRYFGGVSRSEITCCLL